jgi:hypothetical protein
MEINLCCAGTQGLLCCWYSRLALEVYCCCQAVSSLLVWLLGFAVVVVIVDVAAGVGDSLCRCIVSRGGMFLDWPFAATDSLVLGFL